MVMDKPALGTFGAYLEQREKLGWSRHGPAKVSAIGLLGILAQEQSRALSISELMAKSGMGFSDYWEALKSLEAGGLVALTGTAATQVVEMTSKGEEVALLAQTK
ncbi:MAG: hypothetical protein FJW34_15760 [Acidobacteria bacterium]|nr:hypothetical protein [Acidobacteriota bacterium]